MDEFQVLESLNPVPGDRGNPGPIASPPVARSPRRRVRTLYVAAAAIAFGLLLASISTLNRQPEERLLDTVDPQADAASRAVEPEATPTRQAEEGEPQADLSVVGLQPDEAGELNDQSIARLVIPSIELDVMVREGVDPTTLRSGPGHYSFTPLPGQPGNAALAGHRTTYGAPFHRLDEMEPGDLVSVTTRQGTFGYRVDDTVIVDRSDVSALADFGDDRLTLTAGHPKYSTDQRIVVTAALLGRAAPPVPMSAIGLLGTDGSVEEVELARTYQECVSGPGSGFDGVQVLVSPSGEPPVIKTSIDVPANVHGPCFESIGGRPGTSSSWGTAAVRRLASDGPTAGIETLLHPTQVVAVGDGYVGLAWPEQDGSPHPENHRVILVASDDGLTWSAVPDTPAVLATSASLAQHDGEIHIVGLQIDLFSDGPDGLTSYRILHHSSADLQTWDKTVEQLPSPSAVAGRLIVGELAAADFGVVVGLVQTPNFSSGYGEVVDQGFDPDTFCDSTGTASSVTFRVCGTTETIRVRLSESDAPVVEQPGVVQFLYRAHGEAFKTTAQTEIAENTRFPFSLYSIGDRIGLTSDATYETTNGSDWTAVETPSTGGAVAAARGDERVFRASQPSGGITVDGVQTGMVYSSDGEAWTAIDLGPLFADLPRAPVHFSHVQAGEGGWALVGLRKAQLRDFDEIDRDRSSGSSDFTLRSDGFTLDGSTPFGPAVLLDSDDQIVRAWDHFEMTRPDLSGFDVGIDEVVLSDESGAPIVSFAADAWQTLHRPNETFVLDVFFSSDGLNWSIVDSSIHQPFVAVGRDEVVIGRRLFHPVLPDQVSFTTVPTPGG